MKAKLREGVVSAEQPQIKVEVEEEGNDSQSNRAVLDEDLTNFQFEDEVKIEQEVKSEHDDPNTFDVKAMTIGDIENILQNQSREIKAKNEELVECRNTIKSKCLENDTMKRKLREMTEEKNDLKTTNEKLQSLNRTYKARCESLTRQNDEHEDVNAANKLLKNENENLQRKLEESSKEKENLKELARNKINEMTKEMERLKQYAKDTTEKFQDSTEKFQTELQNISEARNKAMAECEKLTSENKTIVKDNDKLVDEKILYARKVRELAKESEEAQKKVQELAVESKAVQEIWSNQQQIINNLKQEKEKLLACNQQVAQSNQYLKRRVDSMTEEKAEREEIKVKLLRMIEEDL